MQLRNVYVKKTEIILWETQNGNPILILINSNIYFLDYFALKS